MCGIATIWNWSDKEVSFARLFAMTKSQMHRGPDGHGYAVWKHGNGLDGPVVWRGPNTSSPHVKVSSMRVGISHNWLAIQDTERPAQQPMRSRSGRYWLTFNGEIYNFLELRDELISEGLTFDTSSDTEVILALWQKLGPEAVSKMRGMFAFVIYDCEEDVLWAVRDRYGIKPLYYAVLPGNTGMVLASEFRGIHACGLIPRKLNEPAVEAFLAAGINKPGDVSTFFEDVNELPPGCLLQVRPGRIDVQRYYQLPGVEPSLGLEATSELRSRFIEVTNLHLRSAREVGTCLSGGLDSTNIASAIRVLLNDRVASFKAFTIGSRGSVDAELAHRTSRQMGFQHDDLMSPEVVDPSDLVDMIIACETPNHVWGPINQYLLLRHIRTKHNVHVLLNGQGGDEVFSGYAWFYPVLESFVRRSSGSDDAASFRRAHLQRLPFSQRTVESFYSTFFSRRKWIESYDEGALSCLGLSAGELLEREEVNYYLNDELDWSTFREREFYRKELQLLLRQEDRLAMWFGIETRVPFLDHTLVEWVGKLDPRFLMRDGYLKYPLRVMFPEMPSEVRFNVTKRGFWEAYSALPYFEDFARFAVRTSEGVSNFVHHQKSVDRLSAATLWRFFQIAVLSQPDEARVWAKEFLERKPRVTVGPWLQRARSVIQTFK